MSWTQPGHLTQRPSGTRLGFSADEDEIGVRVFLNQAIPRDCSTLGRAGEPGQVRLRYCRGT